jgi:hypothetical protein
VPRQTIDRLEPTPEQAVRALTHEIPNYLDRVESSTGGRASELWGLTLAVSGRMAYAEPGSTTAPLGVPDAPLPEGGTRFELWLKALECVLDILGDPESHHRTGFDAQALRAGVDEFFGTSGR